MNAKSLTRLAVAASLGAGMAVSMSIPAHADSGAVSRSGSCSMTSTWTLKAKPDDGRLEIEAEVDSFVVGQNWLYQLTTVKPAATSGPTTSPRGQLIAKGQVSTSAPSGSFELRVLTSDAPGAQKIALRAVNPETNEVCAGSLVV